MKMYAGVLLDIAIEANHHHLLHYSSVSSPPRKILGQTFVPLKRFDFYFIWKPEKLDYFLVHSTCVCQNSYFPGLNADLKIIIFWISIKHRNKNVNKCAHYILEFSLVFHPIIWNEHRTYLKAQKVAQGLFSGVLEHCSNGRDETHLPHSANLRRTVEYIPIGLWWHFSNGTMFISLVKMSFQTPVLALTERKIGSSKRALGPAYLVVFASIGKNIPLEQEEVERV